MSSNYPLPSDQDMGPMQPFDLPRKKPQSYDTSTPFGFPQPDMPTDPTQDTSQAGPPSPDSPPAVVQGTPSDPQAPPTAHGQQTWDATGHGTNPFDKMPDYPSAALQALGPAPVVHQAFGLNPHGIIAMATGARQSGDQAKLQNWQRQHDDILAQYKDAVGRAQMQAQYQEHMAPDWRMQALLNKSGDPVQQLEQNIINEQDPTKRDQLIALLNRMKPGMQPAPQPKETNPIQDLQRIAASDPDPAKRADALGKLKAINATSAPVQGAQIKVDNAPNPNLARGDKGYQISSSTLDKISTPIDARAQRLSTLVDTVNQETPQADSLVAPELLTVMAGGQGSGLRMNEAEIARIVGGRTNLEGLKAALNKWQVDPTKGLSITPAQRAQVRSLIGTVSSKIAAKQDIINNAKQQLVNEDDPHKQRAIVNSAQMALAAVDRGNAQAATAKAAPQGPTPTGRTATNPQTGQKVSEYSDGSWK